MATKTLDRAGKLTEANIRAAMKKTTTKSFPNGNATQAAGILGVPRPSLLYHLRKLGLRSGPKAKKNAKKTSRKARW